MRIFGHILYVLLGGAVSVWLLDSVMDASLSWLVLMVPMAMISLFIATMGMVNLWLAVVEGDVPMSVRDVVRLYLKCWAVVVMGVALCVVVAWLYGLTPEDVRSLVPWLDVVVYAFCGVLTMAALLSILRGRSLHKARLVAAQNENQLLKAQLNPHFLYNMLNNIDALVWIDPERASRAINELSAMMRYQTYAARIDSVTMGEELKHLREYVDLQQMRLPSGSVLFTIDIDDESILIAPLLLIAVVENCFKHGDFSEPATIDVRLEHGVLTLTTDNKARDEDKGLKAGTMSGGRGLGMTVLRRRLEVLYPSRHRLVSSDAGGRHYVTLCIDLNR